MSRPTDQSDEQIREGTETLQSIADDVSAEREKSGASWTVPGDEGSGEDEAETREDHIETDTDSPLDQRLDEQK